MMTDKGPEYIDTIKTGIDYNTYAYLFCKCPNPLNYVWRFKKSNYPDGMIDFKCPRCNCVIGGHFIVDKEE